MRDRLLTLASCCITWAACTFFWMVAIQLVPRVEQAMSWVFMVIGTLGITIAICVHISQAAEELRNQQQ